MKSRWGWCRMVLAGGLILAAGSGDWHAVRAGDTNPPARPAPVSRTNMQLSIVKTEAEWRKELTPEQFRVLRQKGTERAFTGAFWNHHEKGEYRCAGCGMALFASEAKFDSGCGWPSFSTPAATNTVAEAADRSHGLERTEVLCSKCGGHLGHVFDDGPKPTGLRYCINSAALKFEKKKDAK